MVVGRAGRQPIAEMVVAPARIAFHEEKMAHVGSLVEGRISQIKVRLGDTVKAGDVLLLIDSVQLGQLQSEFLAKRAQVEASRPAVAILQDGYSRARQLYDESEGISLAEVQRRQSELAAAQREQITAEADLAAAASALLLHGMPQEQIEQLARDQKVNPVFTVRAPINGQVVEREVTPGELVSPDDEHLLVLADVTSVWVWADIPEAKLGSVGMGSAVLLEVPALPQKSFEGTVTYVSPMVSQSTRTARVRVDVANPDGVLRPGMFARAAVGPVAKVEPVLALPAEAVVRVEGQASVFVPVEGEANTYARRAVAVGERVGNWIPILSGLEEGEAVVVAGTFILKAELGKAGAAHEH